MKRDAMKFLLAACAFVAPLSARAAMETIDITFPAGANFANASSDPFTEFNPALGTLEMYTIVVEGDVTSPDTFTPEIVFKRPGTFSPILDMHASGISGGTIFGTGYSFSSEDLAAVTGTGTAQFLVQDYSNRGGTTAISFTADRLRSNRLSCRQRRRPQ